MPFSHMFAGLCISNSVTLSSGKNLENECWPAVLLWCASWLNICLLIHQTEGYTSSSVHCAFSFWQNRVKLNQYMCTDAHLTLAHPCHSFTSTATPPFCILSTRPQSTLNQWATRQLNETLNNIQVTHRHLLNKCMMGVLSKQHTLPHLLLNCWLKPQYILLY